MLFEKNELESLQFSESDYFKNKIYLFVELKYQINKHLLKNQLNTQHNFKQG
jgi:hypothetical protein